MQPIGLESHVLGYIWDMGVRIEVGVNDLATTHPVLAAEWHPTLNGGLHPQDVVSGTNKEIWWLCPSGHEWQTSGNHRSRGQGCPVCNGNKVLAGFNDLASVNPTLAEDWHPIRNGSLTPNEVAAKSNRNFWWRCGLGHEWSASVSHRADGTGCPYCSNKSVLSGFNDLATLNPQLAAEWHPTKNRELTPQNVVLKSSKRAVWLCAEGHEWEARISNRANGSGCHVCTGQKVVAGLNDLATTNPELVSEWHPTKNGTLRPSDVMLGSKTKVWWVCDRGHEWSGPVGNRSNGSACAVCTGQKVLAGFNDLATTRPDLLEQWHPTKNGVLKPDQVIAGTNKKLWWVCKLGHEWQATGNARDSRNSNCPYCVNKALLTGFNDLATLNPHLAAEWHPTRNGRLTPEDVLSGSHLKIWWQCPVGHEWQARCSLRGAGRGCPNCAKYGFDPTRSAVLYFLTHDAFQARKIGITNRDGYRIGRFQKSGWLALKTVECANGHDATRVERALFDWIRKTHSLPIFLGREEVGSIGGWTETFSMEGPSDAEIIARIEAEFAKLEQADH